MRTRFGVSRYAMGEEEPLSLLPVPEENRESGSIRHLIRVQVCVKPYFTFQKGRIYYDKTYVYLNP